VGISKIIIIILVVLFFPLAATEKAPILYLMQSGSIAKALDEYNKCYCKNGFHDFETLQKIGLILLDQGSRNKDPEVQLITLFGAGISMNDTAQYILENAIQHPDPRFQLIALSLLSRFKNDSVDEVINRVMSSPFLIIRAEGALYLAEKKHPKAFGQIDALMQKAPVEVMSIFPELFATLGTHTAIKALQRLLLHPKEEVRIAAVLNAAKFGRDDLLPDIRRLATHHNFATQEACALALGILKDESSVSKLYELTQSSSSSVRLAAYQALYNLGREETKKNIEDLAQQGDLFAISILSLMPGSEPILRLLLNSKNIQVRTNAALSLLELSDPICWEALQEILIRDFRDLAFVKIHTHGKGLTAWRVVPSAHHKFKEEPTIIELSVRLRESILEKTLELPEEIFLKIANKVFETQQNDLVPLTTHLLENLQTPEAINLLKTHREQVGAPLIRNYCNLALYKIKEEGPYEETLLAWTSSQLMHNLINFRTTLPSGIKQKNFSSYQLTPEETSRLLIEVFESLTKRRNDRGIDLLLYAIQNGNPKNKYALAGLLILATE
jgi:DNA-directed RNA polymerase subunit F